MQRLTLVLCAIPILALLGPLPACTPGSKGMDTAADSETAEASGSGTGSATDSATSQSSNSGPQTSGETTAAEGTTGGERSCTQAYSATECASAGIDGEECGWFEITTWVSNDGVCGDVEIPAGYCFTTGQNDDTCGLMFDSTCPDGVTAVWYSIVGLEIGAVELFVDDMGQTCSGPSIGFTPCSFDGMTFDPPECACGCPSL